MEIVFETHSISTDNEAGIATGWLGGELSAAGREQARLLGERRRCDAIDLVLVSDLARAVETAQIAFVGSGLRVRRDARLRECDYGEWNGMPVARLEAERAAHIDVPYPGGQSYRDVCDQMAGLLAELRDGGHGPARAADRALGDALGARPPDRRRAAGGAGRRAVRLARGLGVRVGVTDRYWRPIEPAEAERVFGRPVEIVAAHLRWLFAVAHCRWDGGEAILKRQPPMGAAADQLRWQHRLTNHLADGGIPADPRPADGRAGRALVRDRRRRPGGRRLLGHRHVGAVPLAPPTPPRPARCWPGCTTPPSTSRRRGRSRRPASWCSSTWCGWSRPTPSPSWPPPGRRSPTTWRASTGARRSTEAYADAVPPAAPGRCRSCRARALHGDWQTNNLFFDGDRISGIIDFHQADHGPRVLDLATAVERNCFFWNRISEGEDDAYDLDHARRAARCLRPRCGRCRRPSGRRFADVLACCQFEYGISFLDYYWGIEGDREKADWAWHTFVLGHAQWWQTDAGRRGRRSSVVPEGSGASGTACRGAWPVRSVATASVYPSTRRRSARPRR